MEPGQSGPWYWVAEGVVACTSSAAAPMGWPSRPGLARTCSREPCRLCVPGAPGARHATVQDAPVGTTVTHAGASLIQWKLAVGLSLNIARQGRHPWHDQNGILTLPKPCAGGGGGRPAGGRRAAGRGAAQPGRAVQRLCGVRPYPSLPNACALQAAVQPGRRAVQRMHSARAPGGRARAAPRPERRAVCCAALCARAPSDSRLLQTRAERSEPRGCGAPWPRGRPQEGSSRACGGPA